jgi:hypothetical protein
VAVCCAMASRRERESVCVYVCVLALLCGVWQSEAITEAQYNVNEWHNQNIGDVREAVEVAAVGGFVCLSPSVIALVSQETGEMTWRRQLPGGYTNRVVLRHEGWRAFTVLEGEGAVYLAMWDVTDGSLLWDRTLLAHPSTSSGSEQMAASFLSKTHVALLLNGVLHFFSDGGELLWSWQPLNNTQHVISFSVLTPQIVAASVSDGSLFKVNPFDKKASPAGSIPSQNFLNAHGRIFHIRQESVLSYSLITQSVGGSEVSVSIPTKAYLTSHTLWASSHPTATVVVVEYEGTHGWVYDVIAFSSQPKQIASVLAERRVRFFSSSEEGVVVCFLVDGEGHPSLLRLSPHSSREEVSLPFLRADVIVAVHTAKALLTFAADGALSASHSPHSSPAWVREESLADIVHVAFADIPTPSRKQSSDLLEEVTLQLTRVVTDIESLSHSVTQMSTEILHGKWPFSHSQEGLSDVFGYRKVILVTTERGKVIGLSTKNGRPLWSHYFGDVTFSSFAVYRPHPHDVGRGYVSYTVAGQAGSTVASLNSLTGELIRVDHFDDVIEKIFSVTFADGDVALLAVDGEMKIHSLPGDEESAASLRRNANQLLFHEVDRTANVVRGYAYTLRDADPSVISGQVVWTNVFPNEQIDSVILSSAANVNVHQPFPAPLVIGDHEYSPYINPNLLFLSTVTSRGDVADSVVNVYMIDASSGAIVYQTFHPQASGPVHMTHSDNWLSYHFWNTLHARNELCTIELYTAPASGRSSVTALIQSFILDFDVRGMGVTKTLYGVTSKELLFATSAGHVIGILHPFLSAQRPHPSNYTNQHRDLFLVPYDPRVIPQPPNFLSSNRTIVGVTHFFSSQAHIESSSLVFAYGHDNFFTIVCPSKAFDFLESDFSYLWLVLTVLLVSAATFIAKLLASRKELKASWK